MTSVDEKTTLVFLLSRHDLTYDIEYLPDGRADGEKYRGLCCIRVFWMYIMIVA